MSLLRILPAIFFAATVVTSCAKSETTARRKNVYLLCVTLDSWKKKYVSTSLQFSLDVIGNRSDILPEYNLQIICGFSRKSVSFNIFYVKTTKPIGMVH